MSVRMYLFKFQPPCLAQRQEAKPASWLVSSFVVTNGPALMSPGAAFHSAEPNLSDESDKSVQFETNIPTISLLVTLFYAFIVCIVWDKLRCMHLC